MTFVRFAFCPWRCRWCDSVYTWALSDTRMGGLPVVDSLQQEEALTSAKVVETLGVSEIVEKVEQNPAKWVCITGGEPLSQPKAFRELVYELNKRSFSIEVETSGLVPLPGDDLFDQVDSWVVDVKTPSSGMGQFLRLDDLDMLRKTDQVKFVVQSNEDLEFAVEIVNQKLSRTGGPQVLVSPVGPTRFEKVGMDLDQAADFIKSNIPEARLSLQMHKFIWGNQRGV